MWLPVWSWTAWLLESLAVVGQPAVEVPTSALLLLTGVDLV